MTSSQQTLINADFRQIIKNYLFLTEDHHKSGISMSIPNLIIRGIELVPLIYFFDGHNKDILSSCLVTKKQ